MSYNFFKNESALQHRVIGGFDHYLLSHDLDRNNPFVKASYDFDHGFYQGVFSFSDPVQHAPTQGTPEEYGRRRIIARLLEEGLNEKVVLDIGAGTLNILRGLLETTARDQNFSFVNCDISGPWTRVNEKSSLELGADKITKTSLSQGIQVINAQYDLNSASWPFQDIIFDFVVSCMALHHVRYENKERVINDVYRSLKTNGSLILIDFFLKQEEGARFTDAGKRGPEECKGYGQNFLEFLSQAKRAGFALDPVSSRLLEQQKPYLDSKDLKMAVKDLSLPLPVNKATWYVILKKI